MSSAPSPVEAPDYILERLVGDTAEPDRITEAARKLGQRTLPAIARNVNQYLCSPIEIEIEAIELGRFAQALAGTGEHNAVIIAPSANLPCWLQAFSAPTANCPRVRSGGRCRRSRWRLPPPAFGKSPKPSTARDRAR